MKLQPVALKSTYEMLIDGDVDAISYDDLSDKHQRNKVVTTSFPISRPKAYVFSLKEKNIDDKDLVKHKGAISKNNISIISKAKKQNLKFSIASSPYQCMQMVIEKTAEYCIAVKEIGLSALHSNPSAEAKIKMSQNHFLEVPVYFSLKKSYAKDLPKIEQSFKAHLNGDLKKYPIIKDILNKDF